MRAARAGGVSLSLSPSAGMHNVSMPSTSAWYSEDVRLFANPAGAAPHAVPLWLAAAYLGANVVLNCLNWYWFSKMIATIRKRFPPPLGTKRVHKVHQQQEAKPELDPIFAQTSARESYRDGVQQVHIDRTEVRRVNRHDGADGGKGGRGDGRSLNVPARRDEGSSEDETMVH